MLRCILVYRRESVLHVCMRCNQHPNGDRFARHRSAVLHAAYAHEMRIVCKTRAQRSDEETYFAEQLRRAASPNAPYERRHESTEAFHSVVLAVRRLVLGMPAPDWWRMRDQCTAAFVGGKDARIAYVACAERRLGTVTHNTCARSRRRRGAVPDLDDVKADLGRRE